MDLQKLYQLLEIPNEVVALLNDYEQCREIQMSDSLKNRILNRKEWSEGIKELQGLLGEDPYGAKILWELLNLACSYSYEKYQERKISDDIFIATMRFCTRALHEHYQGYGYYRFGLAWWFPREISLQEYRIGALEYEFVDGEEREISIHIPSDADFSKTSVLESLEKFYSFRDVWFPQWKNVKLVCNTWMLAPALQELLDENSNILAFQNMFEIDQVDSDATWYIGWIFPGHETVDENLPERTSLQRKVKAHLLAGKKFGSAKGHLKEKRE